MPSGAEFTTTTVWQVAIRDARGRDTKARLESIKDVGGLELKVLGVSADNPQCYDVSFPTPPWTRTVSPQGTWTCFYRGRMRLRQNNETHELEFI